MKRGLFLLVMGLCAATIINGEAWAGKVLFVDSYHEGFAWSDGIIAGVKEVIGDKAELKIIHMDTKRDNSESFKKEAALKAKAVIEEWHPDVVIASDDNASKYLIVPYYMDSDLPFVFCGVNWDAKIYGFPTRNITGMVEVTSIDELIDNLKKFAKGDRVGFLAPETLTAHKEEENYKNVFGLEVKSYYSRDADDWMKGFAKLQEEVDMLIIDSDGGLYNDRLPELVAFTEKNTKVATGACYDFMCDRAMVSFNKVAQEQGHWAAETALQIIGGKKPADIPVAQNSEGTIIINAKLFMNSGLECPYDIIKNANKIIE